MFLREMEKHFHLMTYEGPQRVETAEFILRGPAQVWMDMIWESRPIGEVMTWEDFDIVSWQSTSLIASERGKHLSLRGGCVYLVGLLILMPTDS